MVCEKLGYRGNHWYRACNCGLSQLDLWATFYASVSVMDSVKQSVGSASMGFLGHPRSLQFLLFLQSKSVQENNRRAKTDVSIHT